MKRTIWIVCGVLLWASAVSAQVKIVPPKWSLPAGESLVFEGATNDGFETTLAVTDPTADRAVTFPNEDILAADFSKLTGITNGTAAAGKALVADSNIDITAGLRNVTLTGAAPTLTFTDTTAGEDDYIMSVDADLFTITNVGGQAEALSLDLSSTANAAVLSSTTGVALLDSGGIAYQNTGGGAFGRALVSGVTLVSQGTSSLPTLSAELVLNGDFATNDLTNWTAAAGWSGATGKAVHTAGIGDTTALTQAIAVTNGERYIIVFTTSGRTAGSVTAALGTVTMVDSGTTTALTGNTTYTRSITANATGSVNLSFTPTVTWDGALDDISLKRITDTAHAVAGWYDDAGSSIGGVRGTAAKSSLAIGMSAGYSNTTGSEWTALGASAGSSNTTGSYWTAIGGYAGSSNTTGLYWTALGRSAGYNSTTGSEWTALGASAGSSNTTGLYWTALGRSAGQSNTIGSNWTALGRSAGYSNTTGRDWTALGTSAGYGNTTGSYWTAVGMSAGYYIADGSTALTVANQGVFLGYDTRALIDNSTNEIVIGYQAVGRGNNTATIGNAAVTVLGIGSLAANNSAVTDTLIAAPSSGAGNAGAILALSGGVPGAGGAYGALRLQPSGGNLGVNTSTTAIRYQNTTIGVLSSLLLDDATNYEGLAITPASGSVTFGAVTGGTGADNIDLKFTPAGTGYNVLGPTGTAAPAAGDCDAAEETNRMIWDSTNDILWFCSGASGWRQIATAAP